MAYILVENEKKVPLRGKVASSVRLVSDDFKGEVQIVYNNSMFTESKEDGVMQLPIKILCLKHDIVQAKLEF